MRHHGSVNDLSIVCWYYDWTLVVKKGIRVMAKKYITEARDTGNRGYLFNRFLVEFNLARDLTEANDLIRRGAVELDNCRIKDTQHIVMPGAYDVRIHGDFVAEATVL